jgi:hypothetical protein
MIKYLLVAAAGAVFTSFVENKLNYNLFAYILDAVKWLKLHL